MPDGLAVRRNRTNITPLHVRTLDDRKCRRRKPFSQVEGQRTIFLGGSLFHRRSESLALLRTVRASGERQQLMLDPRTGADEPHHGRGDSVERSARHQADVNAVRVAHPATGGGAPGTTRRITPPCSASMRSAVVRSTCIICITIAV